jgi:SNF2 family DNA or RNA helicase
MSGTDDSKADLLRQAFSKIPVKAVNYYQNKPLYLTVKLQNNICSIKLPYVHNANTQDFINIKDALKKYGFKYSPMPENAWRGDRRQFALFASQYFEYLGVEARILAYTLGAKNRYIDIVNEKLQALDTSTLDTSTDKGLEIIVPDNIAKSVNKDLEMLKGLIPSLRDYQIDGIRNMLLTYGSGKKGFLLCDEQGLGKTVQTIAFLLATYRKGMTVIIMAPDVMLQEWYDRIVEFDTQRFLLPRVTLKSPTPQRINIVNYATLTAKNKLHSLLSLEPEIIVFDEIQNLKSLKSKRVKNVIPLTSKARFILGLTGTLVKNRPVEAYNILRLLDMLPNGITDVVKFIRNFEGETAAYYYRTNNHARYYTTIEAEKAANLVTYLKSTQQYIRRLKKDVLAELPAKSRIFVNIDITNPSDVHLMEAISEEAKIRSMLEANLKLPKDIAMRISTYRRLIGIEKARWVVSYVQNKLEGKNKFIIYAHHNEVIDYIKNKLFEMWSEYEIYVVDGRVSKNERARAVAAFQSQEVEKAIIIASLAVASEGLTLTATDEIVFAETDWVPATMLQAEDRIHRISQQSDKCVYHYIIAIGTLDQYIYNVLRQKERYLKYINTQ